MLVYLVVTGNDSVKLMVAEIYLERPLGTGLNLEKLFEDEDAPAADPAATPGPGDFPTLVPADIPGAPVLGSPTLLVGEDGPLLGLGRDCTVRNAILDLDCRVGDGCRLVNEAGVQEADGPNWAIRGGVIVVPRGAVLEPGTVV